MGRRPSIFTPELMATIPALVAQGFTAEDIAARIGCQASTLIVRCSNFGVSLRRDPKWRRQTKIKMEVKASVSIFMSMQTELKLREAAMTRGITEARLVADLLEVVAKDNLFDAVLDTDERRKDHEETIAFDAGCNRAA